ncbi:MAG: sulfatase [Candidatus Omnitrophica bacterium]|jgi:arylsulfatase A-like enzyme|nr:sulfatase [Candidatus Omnitrophota bacterium]MDD5079155.1 sulfatase [Candidatus Omnitrophota bacterium]
MRIKLIFFCALTIAGPFIASRAYPAGPKYNIVIIVVNALRTDYMGCYGSRQGNTPNIDSLAAEGALFDNAISQSYWTLPSMVSLLTSKYVSAHGVNSRNNRIATNERTLTEVLKKNGFDTAAFTCGLDTVDKYGLEKGFDRYFYYQGPRPVGSLGDILPEIKKWLALPRNEYFFALIHSYDLHPPYDKELLNAQLNNAYSGILAGSALDYGLLRRIKGGCLDMDGIKSPLGPADLEYIKALYSSGIRRADAYVGELISGIKNAGLYDETIIILCADHGEELGERGTFDRFGNQNLYQEVVHVPLIIRLPSTKFRGIRIRSLVGLIDLMPTILDLQNIGNTAAIDGLSIAPLLKDPRARSTRKFLLAEGQKHKWALLRPNGWKLIFNKGENRLYNLNTDPRELRDLNQSKKHLTFLMLRDFLDWRQLFKKHSTNGNQVILDPEMIKNLKKAGYW